ncbi:MAG TPA: DUF6789 family protein [Ktedonobacterales bacterium]|jgi:hypothetical protein|nr:DUF6789 family protein [Ktedonobacterales bacterium]
MSTIPSRVNFPSAVFAGATASAVYAGEMYLDIALTGNPLDDVQLLEGALRGRKARVPVLGMLVHLLNGSALGIVYAVVRPLLPGPNWLKGTLFGALFLVAVWPLTPVLDRIHPLIRRGELPKFNTPVALGQNIARHLIFGLVLGLLYRD